MADTVPKKKKILGSWYKVKVIPPEDPRLQDENGLVDLNNKIIYLSSLPNEGDTKRKVLYHEIGHALLYERGLRYLNDDLEHVFVEAFQDYMMETYG